MDIRILGDRTALGAEAAADVATALKACIRETGRARVMFAAAPSQSDLLEALVREPGVDWSAVTAFHLDEYVDLAPEAPQSFGNWLRTHLFDKLPFAAVHYLGTHGTPDTARAYGDLLTARPIDLACLGIGANGHLAFNDPPVADFADPLVVKEVELDPDCRRQQVDDDCFATLDDVPRRALTVTIPALLASRRIVCVVPGPTKAAAVRDAVTGPISTDCPASALREHQHCTVYLDPDSAALLESSGVSS